METSQFWQSVSFLCEISGLLPLEVWKTYLQELASNLIQLNIIITSFIYGLDVTLTCLGGIGLCPPFGLIVFAYNLLRHYTAAR